MLEPTTWNSYTIRAARNQFGLTQREMAKELGCREQTISQWELGDFEPKNAYQKLLTFWFKKQVNKAKEEINARMKIEDRR